MKRPDFFIVGAPKCGTTAMYEYLRQHPDIFMPVHKEPLYFGSDLTSRYGRMSEADYLALFEPARPGQRAGEASAWYLFSALAATEIREFAGDAQIIIMLRNPVDVMHAQHSQLVFNRQENIADFAEALDAEGDRASGRRLPPGPIRPENLLYRRMTAFSEQVERFFRVFGRERVHVVIFDDFIADTPGEYRRVLEFMEVDPAFQPVLAPANENRRVRFGRLQDVIWNPPILRPFIPRLRRYRAVHRLRSALLRMNSQRVVRTPIDTALRHRLMAEKTAEVDRLSQLLGRDLSHWVRVG